MDGEVGFESEVGIGSRFWVRIPIANLDVDEASTVPVHPKALFEGDRIVVICDERGTELEVVTDYLNRFGLEVVVVSTDAEMAGSLAENGAELVIALLDDEVRSREVLETIHRTERRPFLAVVTSPHFSIPTDLISLIDASLERPISLFELTEMVERSRDQGLDRQPLDLSPGQDRRGEQARFTGRILVAEDNIVNQMVAREFLDELGCTTLVVENGDSAVRAVSSESFDLIFMDCQMPILDGIEATRAIRAMEVREKRPRIPIVALTAHALAVSQKECTEAGMDGYVRKPFSIQDLADALCAHGVSQDSAGIADRRASVPQSPTASESEALQVSALDELLSLYPPGAGTQFVARVIESYISETTKLLEQLSNAVDEGVPEPIQRLAHAIKSASPQVGAIRMAELATQLENQARARDLSCAEAHMDALRDAFPQACEATRAYVRQIDPESEIEHLNGAETRTPIRESNS